MDMKCLDTYALVEIHNNNPKYLVYINENVVITDLTLSEFYGTLYRKYNIQTAEYWYKRLVSISQLVSKEILIKAIKYKIDNNDRNLSFFDCVGYIFSVENKMNFVTGDKEFKNKEGVEWIGKDNY